MVCHPRPTFPALFNHRYHRPVPPDENPWVTLLPLVDLPEWETGEMVPLGFPT